MLAVLARSAILLAILGLFVINTFGQRVTPERPTGPLTLYGDLKVNEADADASRPLSYTVLLYSDGGILVSRLNVANGGRYRFLNLPPAVYDLAVEVDNAEVARVRVELLSARVGDIRQDLELEWRRPAAANPGKVINASATYSRSPANQKLFDSGRKEIDNKRFDEGIALLKTLVKSDRKDFQAWLELGTAYLFKQDFDAAEDAYLHAVDTKSDFLLALIIWGDST